MAVVMVRGWGLGVTSISCSSLKDSLIQLLLLKSSLTFTKVGFLPIKCVQMLRDPDVSVPVIALLDCCLHCQVC